MLKFEKMFTEIFSIDSLKLGGVLCMALIVGFNITPLEIVFSIWLTYDILVIGAYLIADFRS